MQIDWKYFSSWPYDEALVFMSEAWQRVRKTRATIVIGCGSHCERVITIGRDKASCIVQETNILIRHIERGGGMTAHEPGQIVFYPVADLNWLKLSLPDFIDLLEATMIDFLAHIGLCGTRNNSGPGVFIRKQKIGFIGLRIKERIVQHGLALNLLNDAAIFKRFDPCNIKNLAVTSACHHILLRSSLDYYLRHLVYFFLRNLCARTDMGTNFDVGVLLSNAVDSKGTSTFASGK